MAGVLIRPGEIAYRRPTDLDPKRVEGVETWVSSPPK
jgi:hypothetical protein